MTVGCECNISTIIDRWKSTKGVEITSGVNYLGKLDLVLCFVFGGVLAEGSRTGQDCQGQSYFCLSEGAPA